MPILDVGYRPWDGTRTPRWTRGLVVAETGIRLVWRNAWLKRILLFMTIPALVVGAFVGAFEQTLDQSSAREAMQAMLRTPRARAVAERAGVDVQKVAKDPAQARHFAWSYLLFVLFRYPQAFGMILVLGLVAPRLVSYDLRSKGYLLYLSRPLTPAEYIAGKAGIVFFLLFMMAAVPSLLIYVAGLFLSTDSWAIAQTWDLPLRILAATLVLMIPTTAVALAMSSLTQESRYAGFAWFAFWVIGAVSYQVLWLASQVRRGMDPESMEILGEYNPWMLFSPYETLGYLQMQIFGLTRTDDWVWGPWILVVGTSVVGYALAYWRVARILKV